MCHAKEVRDIYIFYSVDCMYLTTSTTLCRLMSNTVSHNVDKWPGRRMLLHHFYFIGSPPLKRPKCSPTKTVKRYRKYFSPLILTGSVINTLGVFLSIKRCDTKRDSFSIAPRPLRTTSKNTLARICGKKQLA